MRDQKMKKTIFILNVLFIMTSPLLGNPADILTDQDIQHINDAHDWCLENKPQESSMDGRRCSSLHSYAKYAKKLATKIPNSCQSEKVER
jgi:hypothetical protein